MAVPALAQQPLTLDRIFASPDLSGPSPVELKLSPDGRYAAQLKNRADDIDRYDLWLIDTATGAQRMLVDSKAIGSGAALSEEEKMRRERARVGGRTGIVSYGWAPDGQSLLVPLDGDLYLATLDGKTRRLTATPQTEVDAQVSEGGRYVSFVRDQNLFAYDLRTGREQQLTQGGGGALSWGTAEFVAQEELDRSVGSWWSPDDARVAVQRSDESKVLEVTRAAIGAEGTTLVQQRYPRAGTPNATVDLYILDPASAKQVKVDLGADPDFYLARVDWAADGRTLYVQRLSRDQQRLDLLAADPVTGRTRILFSETSKTWIDLLENNLRVLKDGSLIWASARSGHTHLYRWQGGRFAQITRGDWDVTEIEAVDEAGGRILFTATKDTPIERHLYAASLDGKGEPVRLTEAGFVNVPSVDRGGRHLLIKRSSEAQPPQVYLADGAGKRTAWVSENRVEGSHPLAAFRLPETRYGTLKAADGQTLHWRMTSPVREPGRKYPVFVYAYGGPHGQDVLRQWGRRTLVLDYMASKGWIVFTIDNRGTGYRGTAFDAPIFRAAGGAEVADQLAGLKWLKAQPYVDADKVAVMGWSYGGYMTLKLLEAAPGAYAAGASVAPVTRWELYDTAYTERYLGDPTKLPKVYAKANALDDAVKITDPLMVIHGMADDNVVFEHSTALFAKLQAERRPFEAMVYPGKTHSISGAAAQVHVWGTIERFLDRTVKGK
ncbi:S9 family peptidase [Sphingomonas jatrophae]|nr:S9 family peptidase [Sphingomonas jatrophae]